MADKMPVNNDVACKAATNMMKMKGKKKAFPMGGPKK